MRETLRREAEAVGPRHEAGSGFEPFGEMTLVMKSAVERDRAERLVGVLQQLPRRLHPDFQQPGRRRAAEDTAELALELTGGESGALRQISHSKGIAIV